MPAIRISDLSPQAQEQIRQQVGDAAFKKLRGGRNKFGVAPKEQRTVNGIVFASKFEAAVYQQLVQALGTGAVQLQPKFLLQKAFKDGTGKKNRAIYYVADFYIGPRRRLPSSPIPPEAIVVDAKGMLTTEFRMKYKMFQLRYNTRLYQPKKTTDVAEIVTACKHYGNIRS